VSLSDLNIDQIAELRLSSDRTNTKIKDDLESLHRRMLAEVEPLIEKRTQDLISGLFPKGGGLNRANVGGLSAPRGLAGQMSKSTALAPTIQPSVRGSRAGSPDLNNGYYGRSSGLVTPTEEEDAETVRREID
jgi:hypothetical protein